MASSAWDARCAGTCGRILPGGPRSLPEGQRMCHGCRRERAGRPRDQRMADTKRCCTACGELFAPDHPRRRVCSPECGRKRLSANVRRLNASRPPAPCDDCGRPTTRPRNGTGRFCETCSDARRVAREKRKVARRTRDVTGSTLQV